MVRPARPEDAERLGEIHLAAWRAAYRGVVPDQELFLERTMARSVALWQKRLTESSGTLVADEGFVKGFVIQGPSRDPDAREAHEVYALYVEPSCFREGQGRVLMAAAEAACRYAGRTDLILWVLEANPRARAFYEACGFTADGTQKTIEEWNGAVELRYKKVLDPART